MRADNITIAIICLTVLECVALLTRTDGAFFMPVVSVISGLAGYRLGRGRDVTKQ